MSIKSELKTSASSQIISDYLEGRISVAPNFSASANPEPAQPEIPEEDAFTVDHSSAAAAIIRPFGKDKYPLSSSSLPAAIIKLFICYAHQKGVDEDLQDDLVMLLGGIEKWDPFVIKFIIDHDDDELNTKTNPYSKITTRHTLREFMDHLAIHTDKVGFSFKDKNGEIEHGIYSTHPMHLFEMIRETVINSGFETFEASVVDLVDVEKRQFRKSKNNPYSRKPIEKMFFETKNVGRIATEVLSRYGELHEDYRQELESDEERQMDDEELLLYMGDQPAGNLKLARTIASVYREGAGYGMMSLNELESNIRRDLKMDIRTELAMRSPN